MNRPLLFALGIFAAGLVLLRRAEGSSASSPADVGTWSPAPWRSWVEGLEQAVSSVTAPVAEAFAAERNLAAFLHVIRVAEGTEAAHGYYTLFGGQPFLELDTHPGVRTWGEWLEPGKLDYTTAAGAYQETMTTWRRLSAKLGTTDFSPATQDAHAVELIREAGALEAVRAGRFDEAVKKVSGIWASLPGGGYPQPHRTLAYVRDVYQGAGGAIA